MAYHEAKEKRKEKKKARTSQRPRVDDVDSRWMMQVMMKPMPRSQGGEEGIFFDGKFRGFRRS